MSSQERQSPVHGASYYGGLGPAIVGVCWSLFAVATVLLALRIFTYATIVKNKGGWALIWACVAWCLGVPSIVLYTVGVYNGLGNHLELIAMNPSLTTAVLFEWIAAVTISFSVGFAKLGAMFYILDVQRRTYPAGRWTMFIFVGVNFLCYVITIPMIFTQCSPGPKLWNPELPGSCSGIRRAYVFAIFTGSWGAATDLLLALYPVALVYSLQIKLKLKLTLCFLMGLGVFTAACSLAKTVQFNRIQATSDATYEIAPLMIWGVTEMWVVLIASSVAPLWPLLRQSASRLTRKTTTSHNVFSHRFFGAAGIFSRGNRNTENSKHPVLDSNSAGKEPLADVSNGGFHRLGSQTNLKAMTLPPGSIEMTKDFSVSEMRRPDSDGFVESDPFGTLYGGKQHARR